MGNNVKFIANTGVKHNFTFMYQSVAPTQNITHCIQFGVINDKYDLNAPYSLYGTKKIVLY